jgi:hypothetical protein
MGFFDHHESPVFLHLYSDWVRRSWGGYRLDMPTLVLGIPGIFDGYDVAW